MHWSGAWKIIHRGQRTLWTSDTAPQIASRARKTRRLKMRNASRGVLFTCCMGSWLATPLSFLHPPPSLFNSSQTPDSPANWGLEYCALGINAAMSEMSTVALWCVRLWGSCNGYWSTLRLMQSCPATMWASCTREIYVWDELKLRK